MNNNVEVHLYVAPKGAVITDATMRYLENHSAERYPKRLEAFSKQFKGWVQSMVKNASKGCFKYAMKHYTDLTSNRYGIEEQFEVVGNKDGLCICIGPSSMDERKAISSASAGENEIRSVDSVITYLEDIFENDQRFSGKCTDEVSNLDLLRGLIDLLKIAKGTLGVLEFELNAKEDGVFLEMVLVAPKVVGYYVGITWIIK